MCDELQKKEYAPVHLQDEGASRGATCFTPTAPSEHLPHFQENGGGREGPLGLRYNGRSRPSYDSIFCVSLRGRLDEGDFTLRPTISH